MMSTNTMNKVVKKKHWSEHVNRKCFIPQEYQIEILQVALQKNVIICTNNSADKSFISLKLIEEFAHKVRRKREQFSKSIILFVIEAQDTGMMQSECIKNISNLKISHLYSASSVGTESFLEETDVLITSSRNLVDLINNNLIDVTSVSLLILSECHLMLRSNSTMHELITKFQDNQLSTRIMGYTSSLFSKGSRQLGHVVVCVQKLQEMMKASIETANDTLCSLRYCSNFKELIVIHEDIRNHSISEVMQNSLEQISDFLQNHTYNLLETYADFAEELNNIPDPSVEPLNFIRELLQILKDMGPWCADKAALHILCKIHQLKITACYEQQFLLLNLVQTEMIKLRRICMDVFKNMKEPDVMYEFSSPKLLRLVEIFRQYKPSVSPDQNLLTEIGKSKLMLDSKDVITLKIIDGTISRVDLEPDASVDNADNIYRFIGKDTRIETEPNDKPNSVQVKKPAMSFAKFVRASSYAHDNFEHLCSLLLVESELTARVLFNFLSELRQNDLDFWWLSPQFVLLQEGDNSTEQSKRIEDVLKKFRTRECNVLIGTCLLEQGYDLPKCNLVIRFEADFTYKTYVQSKCAGLKTSSQIDDSYFVTFAPLLASDELINKIARYRLISNILLKFCSSSTQEPKLEEERDADLFSKNIKPFCPQFTDPNIDDLKKVTMDNAIFLVNRYCARLPSDIFTKLAPILTLHTLKDGEQTLYLCSIQLPINSPLKQRVTGHPMPSKLLAMRIAAMETCRVLHELKELDNDLMPITKENFNLCESSISQRIRMEYGDQSGSTKRRQIYYKRNTVCFNNCRPVANSPSYLYAIKMRLTCPIPEQQNIRGRKIHPPENSPQGFAILTSKKIPKICFFPIFTRCGEIEISIELISENIVLNEEKISHILTFMDYTFTKVLKLKKFFMLFDPHRAENSYFVVPSLTKHETICVDWELLRLIQKHDNDVIQEVSEDERKHFEFDEKKFEDAVVMPWYRNQLAPAFFYVAEIMWHVNPETAFPARNHANYKTFNEYYYRKYGLQIQQLTQPLLDVDHTSGRLNFLTPRYVNRKGAHLATPSEHTKKEIRESLERKQLLVPELCLVHPFSASLWKKTVALPSILYRLNALLIADEIRSQIALEIGLGLLVLEEKFKWSAFNFGWKMKRFHEKYNVEKLMDSKPCDQLENLNLIKSIEPIESPITINEVVKDDSGPNDDNPSEEMKTDPWAEIGTWSNSMAGQTISETSATTYPLEDIDYNEEEFFNSLSSESDFESDEEDSIEKEDTLQIEFKDKFSAEAMSEGFPHAITKDWIEHKFSWEDITEQDFDSNEDILKEVEKKSVLYENEISQIKTVVINEDVVKENQKVHIVRQRLENDTTESGNKLEHRDMLDNINSLQTYGSIEQNVFFEPSYFRTNNYGIIDSSVSSFDFSFDHQPDLQNHPGPSPSIILQALTMSNANDGINLERLETVGDSFLKYAITIYLYCTYPKAHEGKLSYLRSKQVSNLNLYYLGKQKQIGERMIATKFEPRDNWLPPCYFIPKDFEKLLDEEGCPAGKVDLCEMDDMVKKNPAQQILELINEKIVGIDTEFDSATCVPYNLVSQHSISDKSIADCMEALIGAYLVECGPRGALLFMSWLGLNVLPVSRNGTDTIYGVLECPPSPMNKHIGNAELSLETLLDGFDEFEERINYKFRDRSYLLQAMTHTSYFLNSLTDCYQRLEFLGDAILDYLITRHLFEDERAYSPGTLTDLRSALVNNTIFASLAVKYGFHNFLKHLSPGLHEVIQKFVRMQAVNGFSLSEEYYLLEEECEDAEDVEVPKALGDLFESLAGAIYLDSEMSLDVVWKVYYEIMKTEMDRLSVNVPKSPIRELLELEPENVRFCKPEKLADGRRVRVTVEVFGKGTFKGVGRNYCIAKCTAAKCALKHLKSTKKEKS